MDTGPKPSPSRLLRGLLAAALCAGLALGAAAGLLGCGTSRKPAVMMEPLAVDGTSSVDFRDPETEEDEGGD